MKKLRYTETQIIKILQKVEACKLIKDACREYSITDTSYYNCKAMFDGMETLGIKRLNEKCRKMGSENNIL